MVYNELEQEDTLSCVRVRLATIAYLDILLCSIWAIHKIRQSPNTSKATQEFVESHRERLTMHRLPSYSPDYNPIEYLWKKEA
jgi:transposase